MSFFIRKDAPKRRRQGDAKAGKKSRPAKPSLRKVNEEISSESEDNDEEPKTNGHHADDSDFEDNEAAETALEKRHRLTKEYLKQVEEEEKEKIENQDVDYDAIAHRLKEDAMDQVGRLQRKIADECVPSAPSNFRILRGHRLSPTCLRVTNDGKKLISGSKDGSVIKWDLETGQRLHVIKALTSIVDEKKAKGHYGAVSCLALSSDDKYLCTGGADTTVKTWDLRSMELVKTFTGHRGLISGLVFRRNHNQLFSCSHDRSLKIWNLDEMGYVDTMYGHQDIILDIDCMTRERAVTCGGRDRTIRIWKVAEESQLVFHAQSGCGTIECVRLINDDHFVSGADDGLAVWSAMKKKPVCVVQKAHEHWISSVATQSFTDLVASGSWDGQVKLWRCNEDYRALTLRHSLKVDGFINAMAFTPDTTALVCAVGQEHKNGRWWRNKDVKNSIVVCPLSKSQSNS